MTGPKEEARDVKIVCPVFASNDEECHIRTDEGGSMLRGWIANSVDNWEDQRYTIKGRDGSYDATTVGYINDNDLSDRDCALISEFISSDEMIDLDCFLEPTNVKKEWIEATSCSDFVMSLYSPTTALLLSVTCALGTLFVLAAVNQVHAAREQMEHEWLYNGMLVSFLLTALSAVAGAFTLLQFENATRRKLGTSESASIGESFGFWTALNVFCFVAFLSVCEAFAMMSGSGSRSGWLRGQRKKGVCLAMIMVRCAQMLVLYLYISIGVENGAVQWHDAQSTLLLFALMFSMDVLVCLLCRRLWIAVASCAASWLLLSAFSPLAGAISESFAQRSFFQVTSENASREYVFVWFDMMMIELLFGWIAIMLSLPTPRRQSKVWYMYAQFLDFATDLTVLIFWLAGGLLFWASLEMSFIMGSALIQWLVVRRRLCHWKEHAMILLALSRGYTKIRLWHSKDEEWMEIDKIVTQLETFYESYPSLLLGLYIVLSDFWRSYLTASRSIASAQMGPLLLSVAITGLTVAAKTLEKAEKEIIAPARLLLRRESERQHAWHGLAVKALVFVFVLSDFVVRAFAIATMYALAQGRASNAAPSARLCAVFLATGLVLLAEQGAALYWSGGELAAAALYAAPSVLSCSPTLFSCFGARGIPNLMRRAAFFRLHWATVLQAALIVTLCLSVHYQIYFQFGRIFLTFLVCLALNLASGLALQFGCEWKC